jgi:hypothetical protein
MTETQLLRARINELVAQLGNDMPQQKLARALMAKACDVALNEVGAMGAISMAEQATNLLAGRCTEERIRNYLQIKL